jgi:small subunit ribosomal protein S20
LPNIKSAEKRVLIARVRSAMNKAVKTNLRTNLKKFDAAVAAGNKEAAESCYRVAVSTIDKAVKRGVLHKNNAAHKKSSASKKLNSMNA